MRSVVAAASLTAASACLVAAAGAGGASTGGWRPVTLTRHTGVTSATLAYESRPQAPGAASTVRRLRLVVRRRGGILVDRSIRTVSGIQGVRLKLRNVWGSAEPEALVSMWECGNRCGVQLAVALTDRGRGRVLWHDFGGAWPGDTAWSGQERLGRFYFVSRDQRFFCTFSDCASSTTPIQVFSVDAGGRRMIDVTRTRRDLIAADAAGLLAGFRDEVRRAQYATKSRAGYDPLGVLAPWCADEYLLGRSRACRLTLSRALTRGYLNPAGGGARRAVNSLYAALRAWGYARG
jgi:hypothetical protein